MVIILPQTYVIEPSEVFDICQECIQEYTLPRITDVPKEEKTILFRWPGIIVIVQKYRPSRSH